MIILWFTYTEEMSLRDNLYILASLTRCFASKLKQVRLYVKNTASFLYLRFPPLDHPLLLLYLLLHLDVFFWVLCPFHPNLTINRQTKKDRWI